MDYSMLHAASDALLIILDPTRLMFLGCGVLMGLALGILPGVGGIAGTAMLLPFTYNMESHTAFAFLLGLGSVVTTADPITAILFGVPGHAASAATTLDGFPMTKRGEAGRALGASYMSALMGGLFGAALMGLSIPLLRPVMLYVGSPELLAFAVFGISMVSVLSGNAPLRGLTAACLGVMLALVGSDPQTNTMRWTLDSLYLWDGLPLVPLTLGVYALAELCDLAISRKSVAAGGARIDAGAGLMQGVRDCFTHWFLVLRCSWLGASLGAIPGIGPAIIDWIAYGHALRTEKGAALTFGKGDVRGVIAAESSTNSREGGALVPTVAFGVPASAGMAILLGAFLIHGLVPGPEMLTKNLDITYSMVWSIALANILGSGLCFLFSGQFAKLATLRYTLIMPVVLSLIYVGAFEGTRQWGDLYSLVAFGLLGWIMKQNGWPRPPLVLGFILGKMLERYLFISIERYGTDWLTRPAVIAIFALAAIGLVRPFLQDVRGHGGLRRMAAGFGRPHFALGNLFPAGLLVLFAVMLVQASDWELDAKIIPVIVGSCALLFCALSLANEIFRKREDRLDLGLAERAQADIEKISGQKIYMDIASTVTHLPRGTILARAAMFFGWLLAIMGGMAAIGLIPTVPIYVACYMRREAREPWRIVVPMALALTVLITLVFDKFLAIPWPPTLIGTMFPAIKALGIPSL